MFTFIENNINKGDPFNSFFWSHLLLTYRISPRETCYRQIMFFDATLLSFKRKASANEAVEVCKLKSHWL